MKYSPFLPRVLDSSSPSTTRPSDDHWKQKSVDESVRHIIAELKRQKHDELMKTLTTLNELFNPPK